tara:strand:+ start:444 stop:821 length:378 start_codon:yes stop_codon:yes gene_type:complete
MNNKSDEYMCPLRMSDGRSMTDYRPKCMVNYDLVQNISDANLVKSSYETRMYLQKNASDIMKNQTQKSIDNLIPHTKCKKPVDMGTLLPEKYIVSCNSVSCNKTLFDINGLGDGRVGDTSLLFEN